MIEARDRAKKALAHFAGQGLVKALGAWEEYGNETMRLMRRGTARLFIRHSRAVSSRGSGAPPGCSIEHGKVLPVTRQPLPPQVC